jgi:hypothetical protein
MYSQPLPTRPSLVQLKRRAHELHTLHTDGKQSAAARIIAHHPRFRDKSPEATLGESFALADAQLVIAREHGFQSWAALKHLVETKSRIAPFKPHPNFGEAVAALVAGDLDRLRRLLASHPDLALARTNLEPPYHYFTGATLLHHVAWNPSRDEPVPPNIVDVARLLLDHGAEVDAMTFGRNAGTTMGLICTSRMASDANVSGPLIDVLLEYGRHSILVFLRRIPRGQVPPSSSTQMQQMYAEFGAWKEKHGANIIDIGGRLQPTGKVLRASGVTDGPFAEAKEVVGGYMVIAAESYEHAIHVARECPGVIGPDSSVEIREIAGG